MRLTRAKFCNCAINQLRSFWKEWNSEFLIQFGGFRKQTNFMAPRRPMIVLHQQKGGEKGHFKPSTFHHQPRRLTKSSNNSASELNLLTNPLSPSDPLLPSATKGLNLLSSAVSRNTMRGYAMGMPVCMIRCSTPLGRLLIRSKTRLY